MFSKRVRRNYVPRITKLYIVYMETGRVTDIVGVFEGKT